MPDLHQPLMIITDLDGSLLDHHTYRWDAATEWLTTLKQYAVPLVICSSKTAAEIIPLQKGLASAVHRLLLKTVPWCKRMISSGSACPITP